jgi:hypothetical protein
MPRAIAVQCAAAQCVDQAVCIMPMAMRA